MCRIKLNALIATLSLGLILPHGASNAATVDVIILHGTIITDETFKSRFLLGDSIDGNLRPIGPFTEINAFDFQGKHWNLSGNVTLSGSPGFSNELLEISGVYTHITNPHANETSNSYSFSRSFNAFDVAKNALGDAVPTGALIGTLFDVFDSHPGAGHDDSFTASFNLLAGGISASGPKDFKNIFFDFNSTHPDPPAPPEVPLPAALPLFGSGLAVMGLIGWYRRQKAAAQAMLH